MIHDPCHATDILNDKARKAFEYVEETVHRLIKACYSRYSQSPKKLRGVMRLAEVISRQLMAVEGNGQRRAP